MAAAHSLHSVLVFCPPLPGKPNPKEKRPPLDQEDTRTRVKQSVDQNMVWLGAFHRVRPRFKQPEPTEETLPERGVEQAMTRMKKGLRHWNTVHYTLMVLSEKQKVCLMVTKTMLENSSRQKNRIENTELMHGSGYTIPLRDAVRGYLKSSETDCFYAYFLKYVIKQKVEHYARFLSEIKGPTLQKAYQEFCLRNQLNEEGWPEDFNQLDCQIKAATGEALVRIEFACKIHLVVSDWKPTEDSFESLVKELQDFGYLCATGYFGRSFYKQDPLKWKTIRWNDKDYPIFAWTPRSRDPKPSNICNAIILVGAEIVEGRRMVYYMDARNESDPASEIPEKIYTMGYDTLINPSNITSYDGLQPTSCQPNLHYAYRRATLQELTSAIAHRSPQSDEKKSN